MEAVRAILQVRPERVDRCMSGSDEHRALHYAVLQPNPAIVRLLMQHGADARGGIHPHREATGPLTLAVDRGYGEIAAIIREEEHRRQTGVPKPVDTDLPSEIAQAFQRGDEPTFMTFLEKRPELIRLADPLNGVTPLHKAAAFLLQPHRARDDPWWFGKLSDARGNLTCLRHVLDRCDPNVRGAFGRTILHDLAAEWCNSEDSTGPATMLLDAGARLDARDDLLKSTPLGWACRWGLAAIIFVNDNIGKVRRRPVRHRNFNAKTICRIALRDD